MPGIERFSISELVAEATELQAAGHRRGDPVRDPGVQGRGRIGRLRPGGGRADGGAGAEGGAPRAGRDHRRLPVRVHVARPLRRRSRRRGRQRRHDRAARARPRSRTPTRARTSWRPSDMMDGRVGAIRSQLDEEGHPNVAIIAYSAKYASAFYGPFREAAESTPEFGDRRGYQMDPANALEARARGGARPRGGRRRGDGEARDPLPRRDPPREGPRPGAPVAAYHVSGEYSMLKAAAQNGWIDERAAVLETPDRDPARRAPTWCCTYLREGGRGLALSGADAPLREPRPKVRSRRDGAAVPLDDDDKRLMNLLQSSFPLEPEPFVAHRRARRSWRWTRSRRRTQRLLDERIIREITPIFDTRALGYASMLVAAKVDDEQPPPRRADHQLPPRRLPQLPAHARVQPLVHDRDPARLRAGPRGHARGAAGRHRRRVDPPAPHADAVQDQHEPGDGAGNRGAGGRGRRRPAARARAPALRRHRHRRDPRAAGPDGGHRAPLRRRRRARSGWPPSAFLEHLEGMVERKLLRRVAAILYHRRAGFSANGMGVWRVPEEQVLEVGSEDGRRARDLPLLPAAHLPGLALLGVHDGPRALEGGVRRDPRPDRRGARPARRRPRGALLVDRVQEDPAALLHRRLRATGSGSTPAHDRGRVGPRHTHL